MAGGRLRRPPRLGKKRGEKGRGSARPTNEKTLVDCRAERGGRGAARDGSRAPSPVGPERIVGLEFDAGL